jgi:hypothetical protein
MIPLHQPSTCASAVLENRRRRHAKSRAQLLFLRCARANDSRIALQLARNLRLELPLARATKEQYDRTIGEGLCVDKSGIAKLPFKDRHDTPAITFKPPTRTHP